MRPNVNTLAILVVAFAMLVPAVRGDDTPAETQPKCGAEVHALKLVDHYDAYNGSKCYVPMHSASVVMSVLLGPNGKVTKVDLISAEVDPPEAKECVVKVSAAVLFYGQYSSPPSECLKTLRLTYE